jgi:tRNA G37 N-methylase Trm5
MNLSCLERDIAEFLMVQRFYERTELALVSAYLKPGMTVIDVGANIGVSSILAQKRMKGTGIVWAFGPSSQSFERLEKNLELNRCQSVRPFREALGAQASSSVKLTTDVVLETRIDTCHPISPRLEIATPSGFLLQL